MIGTPGFVGSRLREAREARGMTAPSLAEILGVSRQAISQYESDQQSPRPEIMERLPGILNVKSRFFFRPVEGDESTTLFFRSLSAATKAARLRARHRQEWLHQVIRFVERLVELPAPNIPALDVPADPLQLSSAMIEEAALRVRRYWGLGDGAISDLVLLLENNGIIVSRGELWSEHLDAFSRWRQGRPFVFLSVEKGSAARSRLDAAHELGHLVLHRSVTPEQLARKALFKRIEEQAFEFAGAFLLPATSFANDLRSPTLEMMRALKPTWKVSIKAMLMRAVRLDLVSADTTLWRSYARRGWNREEPLDREMLPEEPRLLRKAIELMVSAGAMSHEEVVNRFDFSARDIEELAGLEPGYLAPRAPTVRLLQLPKRPSEDIGDPRAVRGEVIPFPKAERGGG